MMDLDKSAWLKAKTITELVLEHGNDLTELVNKELEVLKGNGIDEYKCGSECEVTFGSSTE